MARSNYVYIAMLKGRMIPEAAFTVKYELHNWLIDQGSDKDFILYRAFSGRYGAKTVTDITSEFYD